MGTDGEKNWCVDNVRQLVEGRGGGSGLWQLEGRLVALGTGRQLARLVGVEEVVITQPVRKLPQSKDIQVKRLANSDATSPDGIDPMQVTVPPTTHDAELLIRHSLFYKENESDSLMRTFRFRPTSPARLVSPILPSASSVRVALNNDGSAKLTRTFVIDNVPKSKQAGQGDQEDVEGKIVASANLSVGNGGSLGFGLRRMLCASWSFIGRRVRIASGAPALPGVVEQCDYVLGRRDGVWHWSRVGRCPPWYGRGQCVTYLDARKVPAWRMLDDNLRTLLTGAGRTPLRTERALKGAQLSDVHSDSEEISRQTEPSGLVATNSSNSNQKSRTAPVVQTPQAKHQRRRKFLGIF